MMYHPAVNILGTEISTWFIFGGMNMVLGKAIVIYLGYQRGIDFSAWLSTILFATLGAAIGAIVMHSVLGVLIGFIGCFFLSIHFLKIRQDIGDILAVYIAFVFVIGRIGCLLNGCCIGSPANIPWGIYYPEGTPAHWLHHTLKLLNPETAISLSIHPIQLYEVIYLVFSAGLILRFAYKLRNRNASLPLFLGAYMLFRFGIEFIRDMTNIWWSVINFGPFSVLQWFLIFFGTALILWGIYLNKQFRSSSYTFKPNAALPHQILILVMTYFIVLSLKAYFHPIHLFQLSGLLLIGSITNLLKIKTRLNLPSLPTIPSALICIIFFLNPLISQGLKKVEQTGLTGLLLQNEKYWIYACDTQSNNLVRLGDEHLSLGNFTRIRTSLQLFDESSDHDSLIHSKIKRTRTGINYHIAGGLNKYRHTSQGCGGEMMTYDHHIATAAVGIEKEYKRNVRSHYLGIRGNSFSNYRTKTGQESGETTSEYFSTRGIHGYGNLNFKWVGIGGGLSVVNSNTHNLDKNVLLNYYLRLGPPLLNLEMGLMDRYVGISNPMGFHLNLGFLYNESPVRFGMLTQNSITPLNSVGIFMQLSYIGKTGIIYHPSLIFSDGLGFHLNAQISR